MRHYTSELRRTASISGVRTIAAQVEERGQIARTRREMSREVGERVIAIWQDVAVKCAFRPFPVHDSVWSMLAEFNDGRILEFDASGAAPERPVKQLIAVTGALIDFASNRLDENGVLRAAVAAQAEVAGLPSFPAGVDKRTYK